MCTVKYTPTLCGPHQLSTNIPGSHFTVHVLLSPVMTEAVERRSVVTHTIVGSKSGEEVVSESAHIVEWIRRLSHLYLMGLYKEDSLMILLVLPCQLTMKSL